MDPFSLTASIIGVLGVGGQAAKGIAKLASLRGTPELVLALNNEISDLQVVVLAIQDLFDRRRTSGVPFPGQRAGEINIDTSITNSLQQANNMVIDLEAFYKRLKVSAPGPSGTVTFNRSLWIREQGIIKKMKEDLRSVRLKLTTALGALNASAIFHLESNLRTELQEQKRYNQQTAASQSHQALRHETNIQNLHQKVDSLQTLQHQFRALQDQALLQQETIIREPITRLLTGQDRLELRLSAVDAERIANTVAPRPQLITRPLIERSSVPETFRRTESIQVSMSISRAHCAIGCVCICHRRQTYRTPRVLDRVFGILLLGYTGIPRVTPHCSSRECIQRSVPAIKIAYFFPLWLLTRAFIVFARLSSSSGPELIIRVPRIVSESSRIFHVCDQNDIEGVQQLLKQGLASTFDISHIIGQTPLQIAIDNKNVELCRILLLSGADPYQEDYHQRNSYDLAWTCILSEEIKSKTRDALIALFPGDDFVESQEFSILHRTVLGLNSLDLGTLLASSLKSELDKYDASGRTALWWAIYKADFNATSLLLSYGADVNKKTFAGWSPIHTALYVKNRAIIRLLLGQDCDMAYNTQGWLPLHLCAYFGLDSDIFEMISARTIDTNSTTLSCGFTALMLAVQERYYHSSKFLIARGADINKVNLDGECALHIGVQFNSHKSLNLILQKHASYILRTKAGENILHRAAQFGDLESIQILHAHNLNALNTEERVTGHSPVQRFKNMKNMNAIDIANLRDDVSPEWHTMFRKLIDGIKFPGSKLTTTTPTDVDMDEFHDALEHMGP